jgi:RNA polymerase sigma-70 factor (ECF subfamily)
VGSVVHATRNGILRSAQHGLPAEMAHALLSSRGMDPSDTDAKRALAEGRIADATTLLLRRYGPEILGYLAAVIGDDDLAAEAYGHFAERFWRGLPAFRGESSPRTWAYRIAWRCAQDVLRDPFRRRGRALRTSERSRLAAVASTASPWRRPSARERFAGLRRQLRPSEQTLLVLRLDRGLSWREVALVLADEGAQPPSEAALRKRFEALKDKLRQLLRAESGEAA